MRGGRLWLIGAAWLCIGSLESPAFGQEQGTPAGSNRKASPASVGRNTYGTADLTVHTVNAFAFEPFDSLTTHSSDGKNGRYSTILDGFFEAPVLLPAGAIIDHIEIDGCDTSATAALASTLFVCSGGACSTPYAVSTGAAATPGCDFFSSPGGTSVVDNFNNTYTIEARTEAGDGTTKFRAVRVFYRLQISPAPSTATFADVPTNHIYFRAVEALFRSRITVGCSTPGNFCPDDFVRRGEMAAFLSRALGLHFPN